VLARLGGKKGEPGLFAFASTPAQMILSIADEVDEGIEARVAYEMPEPHGDVAM
jgi:hypothetical protein